MVRDFCPRCQRFGYREQPRVQDLYGSVHHPSAGRTLGMPGEVCLEDTENGIIFLPAKVHHHLIDGIGLVLIVCLGAGSVEGCNAQVINS